MTSATTAAAPARRSRRCRTTRSRCGTTTRSHRDWPAGWASCTARDMFAAIDNTVTLPGYTRADAAVYFSLERWLRLQVNVENLFGKRLLHERRQQHEHLAWLPAHTAGRADHQVLGLDGSRSLRSFGERFRRRGIAGAKHAAVGQRDPDE